MPSRKRINLDRVNTSLSTLCPQCGHEITPAEVRRVDFYQIQCPKCEAVFVPGSKDA